MVGAFRRGAALAMVALVLALLGPQVAAAQWSRSWPKSGLLECQASETFVYSEASTCAAARWPDLIAPSMYPGHCGEASELA